MPEPIGIDAAAERVEALLNGFADPSTQEKARELVRVLMELYGAAFARVLEIVHQGGDSEQWLLERLADDRLIASLLLVHGLHPIDQETRIRRALARVERFLEAQHLVLDGVEDGTARVRVEADAGGKNVPVPPALAAAIEQAVRQAAPDVDRIEIGGVPHSTGLVQIGSS